MRLFFHLTAGFAFGNQVYLYILNTIFVASLRYEFGIVNFKDDYVSNNEDFPIHSEE